MGLKSYDIQLDNPWNTYYCGQTINGQVNFTFDSPKKIRGILIRFVGESDTSWQDTRKTTNQEGKEEDEVENFTGHEEYFQIQYYLLGSKSGNEIELPAGTHAYPFTCALPPTLPSSFEGAHGHVRYTVKIILDRPWKFDQEIKMAFTVISPVDLNANARLKEPYKLELEKSFCCLCCASGPLSTVTHLPVTGFVSGQIMPITCECDNASNVHINKVNFVLRKLVTFRVTQPRSSTKREKVTIAELGIGPVPPGETKTYTQQLAVPSLPPSNLVNCSLIDVDYQLHIEVDVSGPHQNLKGNIPIVLGTIPISSFVAPAPNENLVNELPTASIPAVSPPAGMGGAIGWSMGDPGTNNILPPTFHETDFKPETIMSKEDSEHTQIYGGNYTPRYPTYQFSQNN